MNGQVRWERRGAVAEITLDRPAKHNAMTPAMAEQLARACREIDADDTIRVVVLAGGGTRAFCAGSDLHALEEYASVWHFRNRVDYASQVRNLRKPCIAALKGWVLGGGLELALGADMRVAAPSTRLGAPEVTHGWVGAGGASQLLPRLVGYGRASMLLLSGDPIDAATALAWGLVELTAEEGAELEVARGYAERLARHSPVALETVKAAVRASMTSHLDAGLRYENEVMALAFASGNADGGIRHFKARKNA